MHNIKEEEESKKKPLKERIASLDFDPDELNISDESFGQILLERSKQTFETNLSLILKDWRKWHDLSPNEQKAYKSIFDKISPATLNEYLRKNSNNPLLSMVSLGNKEFAIVLGKLDPILVDNSLAGYSTNPNILTKIVQTHDANCILLFLGAISPLTYIQKTKDQKFWPELIEALSKTNSILPQERVEFTEIFTVLKDFITDPVKAVNRDPKAVLNLFLKLPINGHYAVWLTLLANTDKIIIGQNRDSLELLKRIKLLRMRFAVRLSDGRPDLTLMKTVRDSFEMLSPEMVTDFNPSEMQLLGECLFKPIGASPAILPSAPTGEVKTTPLTEVRNWINGMYFLILSAQRGNSSAITEVNMRCTYSAKSLCDDGKTVNAAAVSKEINEKRLSDCLQTYYQQIKVSLIKQYDSSTFASLGLYRETRSRIPKEIYDLLKNSQINKKSLLQSVELCLSDEKAVKSLNSSSLQGLIQLQQVLLTENTLDKIKREMAALQFQAPATSSSSSSTSTSSSSMLMLSEQRERKDEIKPLDLDNEEESHPEIKQPAIRVKTPSNEIVKLTQQVAGLKDELKEVKDGLRELKDESKECVNKLTILLSLLSPASPPRTVVPPQTVFPAALSEQRGNILLAPRIRIRSRSVGSLPIGADSSTDHKTVSNKNT